MQSMSFFGRLYGQVTARRRHFNALIDQIRNVNRENL
jgi:hypothetical protein